MIELVLGKICLVLDVFQLLSIRTFIILQFRSLMIIIEERRIYLKVSFVELESIDEFRSAMRNTTHSMNKLY